ncbi:hypothetical protein K461DRAFT_284958 [Myriangium duriaei CBS 260.36]|uniref:TPR domain-containing protein n=1 Tax=Myriangium duriaei CBS 260.36 TaxID=1168546 RepID=A0A9P4MIV8_9PEZI|nr:hypothetical protein K461DRAFT_284958 [Myriangium duriaei CBS 260.36]
MDGEYSPPLPRFEQQDKLHSYLGHQTKTSTTPQPLALPALNLLGEISIELGDEDAAKEYFLLSVSADPEGQLPDEAGGGAEKFLWLAQLSTEGGFDSVQWFEKGVAVLKRQIAALEGPEAKKRPEDQTLALLEDKRLRVARALCSVAEIYMTDLSWEEDAEQRCEGLITEALLFAPEDPGSLQTLASIRLSQVKMEEARSALSRSMAVWKELDPDDEAVPDFAARISLARLLMEAEMEEEAMVVLERLALEDDQSVEACYLGGWCLNLMAEKRKAGSTNTSNGNTDTDADSLRQASWKWLRNTIKLWDAQEYEDIGLRQHTEELLESMRKEPGFTPPAEGAEEVEEWVDEEDSGDEEMAES